MPEQPSSLEPDSLSAFRAEIKPIFSPKHFTLGHGTLREEDAARALEKGFFLKVPDVFSTSLSLRDDQATVEKILNWPHKKLPFVVVLMFPKGDIGRSSGPFPQLHLFEEVEDEEGHGNYRLNAKFIKGYINVPERKLVVNPQFEEDPEIPLAVTTHRSMVLKTPAQIATHPVVLGSNTASDDESVW